MRSRTRRPGCGTWGRAAPGCCGSGRPGWRRTGSSRSLRGSAPANCLGWSCASCPTCSRPAQELALVEHRIDLGVLRPPLRRAGLVSRFIGRERFVLAVPLHHRLVGEDPVALAELRDEDFVVLASSGSVVAAVVDQACLAAGFLPRRAHQATETSIMLTLVAAGLGVALLPESVLALRVDGVRYVPVADDAYVELALAWRGRRHLTRSRPPGRGLGGQRVRPAGLGRAWRAHRLCRRPLMKIVKIEAIPFAIPYRKPLRFASGEVHVADHVLVRVHTDDGVVGVAEAPPRPYTYGETQESIVAVIGKLFAPQLVGVSALDREVVHARMGRTVGNPAAKAAVDMALWDAVGRTLGLSVTQLLGGWTDRMRVAHMVGFASDAEMVAEAERVRIVRDHDVQGQGRPSAGRVDVRACRALRNALGPDVELYVDGNHGWSPAEAARALRAMADLDLTLAEELCPADDVLGRRWLASHTAVPTVADESATTPGEVTRELLGGSANMISIKTARTGFTASQRILHQCEGLGVEVVMGNQIDGQIGTACAVAFGAAHRHSARRAGELSNFLDMTDDLLTEPLVISGGELTVRPRPGIGLEVDPEKLARYRLDR